MKRTVFGLILILVSSVALANGATKGGDEFRKTAVSYEQKATQAKANNMTNDAAIYARLAEIKREAAKLADQGLWSQIDWSEYYTLNGRLSGGDKRYK